MNRNLFRHGWIPLLAGLTVAFFSACDRQSESAPPPPVETTEAAAANSSAPAPTLPQSAPPPRPAVIPSSAPQPTAVVIPVTDVSATLGALTQALRKYSAEKQRVPASIEEVAGAGYMRAVPPPPAGKKYVIDRKRLTVELANQ